MQVGPGCDNMKWNVQCKSDLIAFCKEYKATFEGWADNVYPPPGEEVDKRVQLVDKALAHIDRFRSCDGDYLHWTGYFVFK